MFRRGSVSRSVKSVEPWWHTVLIVERSSAIVLFLEDSLFFDCLFDFLSLVGFDVSSDFIDYCLPVSLAIVENLRCHYDASWWHLPVQSVVFVCRVRIKATRVHLRDSSPRLLLMNVLYNLELLLKTCPDLDSFLHQLLVLPVVEVLRGVLVDISWRHRTHV